MSALRLLLPVLPLICLSCADQVLSPSDLFGTFEGTFTITHSSGVVETGSVSFTFEGNQYTCTPEKRYLPPGGSGVFDINNQTIRLTDTAIHTAEFDWTLILHGVFSISFDGSRLILEQYDLKYQRHRMMDLVRR